MGENFKFQAQDSFLEQFFWEIGRFEKRNFFSEKKAPSEKSGGGRGRTIVTI